jgi:DNA-binding MarR family transcriptional regulator
MKEKLKPFIPSWLDESGMTAAEIRVFIHLLRSADNTTGIAFPSYARMIAITGLSKSTIRRAIDELKRRELIVMIGKPFAGSCRYKMLPIVSPEGQKEASNSSTSEPIEAAPIVPPVTRNSPSSEPSIVPPEGQEGNPLKEIHLRKSKKSVSYEPSSDAIRLSTLFKSSLPNDTDVVSNWKISWPKTFDQLIAKGRNLDEIEKIIRWARTESFWRKNFMSPSKLTKRNNEGVAYYDVFREGMNSAKSSASLARHSPPDTSNRPNDHELI